LAVLRIEDTTLTIPAVPFSLKSGNLDLGASIYTLGFPLFLSGLGNEPKFTDGKVSSKTGFNNAVNSYQTNLGVQPGNSGGPVFNTKGELVGVVSAKITNADNVSYAVKTSYLQLLLEGSNVDVPTKNTLAELSLEEQLKRITEYVVLIKAY
jgi:S1-C subfamily serine protease